MLLLRAVYRRENEGGLSPTSILFSKMVQPLELFEEGKAESERTPSPRA